MACLNLTHVHFERWNIWTMGMVFGTLEEITPGYNFFFWSGKMQPSPLQYSCLENPHEQRSLAGCSPWGHRESDTTERLSTARYRLLFKCEICWDSVYISYYVLSNLTKQFWSWFTFYYDLFYISNGSESLSSSFSIFSLMISTLGLL